ncbi:hypothetical protein SAMN02746065_11633 [Desulfocicer vacuolatum DSM 3385]|uniref:Uncharacterized protein n=1 Tax=Desulfocicer vacuolatum DSM 3385 TaxID=1121400 RepID=A0A1W2DAN8_9BACT|nr:hypothetical protein [Desulfocicer vacuolatum]SMC94078.1 hypothetical protein SAMN02746065_11633 [Desulfocicer vacuolatum DSM 3385]
MEHLKESQRARVAIREFKTITDSLAIRGFYRPSGRFGKALEGCLRDLSPEIYGTMNDAKVVELKGLEYVIDRLPQGVEKSTKIILTDEDDFEDTPFKRIEPLKRRRVSYRISEHEFCFIVSRGISEIYDIITHMTFLNIEAKKIYLRMHDDYGNIRIEWGRLEKVVDHVGELSMGELDSALWNLSIILGRPYNETRETYEYLEKNRIESQSNTGLFSLIYHLGRRIENEKLARENALVIYFAPSLMSIIGHQKYGKIWAAKIKKHLSEMGLKNRPLHIISANLHSVLNVLYGYGALVRKNPDLDNSDIYHFFNSIKNETHTIQAFAETNGLVQLSDESGSNTHCQLIDTAMLEDVPCHPGLNLAFSQPLDRMPVILVMDYAFGAQAFELMEQLLKPGQDSSGTWALNLASISIMGKAGTLTGEKGDIMLATAHVLEGTSDNYLFSNDLTSEDFDADISVHRGTMATVLGTSLQNKDVLGMFQSDWNAVGLEMEGGHYHKAINASVIKGNILPGVSVRYAYYASDNPLMTGNTLAAGAMGMEGVRPTYMITMVILEKIMGQAEV